MFRPILPLTFVLACGSITPSPERCGETFTVIDSALLLSAENAAARWSAATGCDISIVPENGIPIRFATEEELKMPYKDGRLAAGVTHVGPNFMVEDIGYSPYRSVEYCSVRRTRAHEMGHAIGCWRHTEQGGQSVLDELWSVEGRITEEALSCVCERLECA